MPRGSWVLDTKMEMWEVFVEFVADFYVHVFCWVLKLNLLHVPKNSSWRAIREGLYRVHLFENAKSFQVVEFDRESWWFTHWHWLLIPNWSRSARTLRSLAPGRFLTCTSKFYVSVDYAPVWISCRLSQNNVGSWLVVNAVVSRPLSETFLKITEDHHIILHLQYSSVFTIRLVPLEAMHPEIPRAFCWVLTFRLK